MSLDHSPLPRETIPPGWGPVELHDERYVYLRSRPHVELIAVRTHDANTHPNLGLGCSWALRYRISIGELTTTETLGCVSTRHAALEGLRECMHCVHEHVECPDDPVEVRTALNTVSLTDPVPEPMA